MANKKAVSIERAFCSLLRENDIKKITVSLICREAGVSRATFYAYFENVQSLLSGIEERTLHDILSILEKWDSFRLSSSDADGIAPPFLDISRYIYRNRHVFCALFGPHGDEPFIYRYEQHIYQDFLRYAQAEGITRLHKLLASSCAGAVIALCRTWITDISLAAPEEIARLQTAIACRMLTASDRFFALIQDGSPSGPSLGRPSAPAEDAPHTSGR